MREIHDRMPVILGKETVAAWLDSQADQGILQAILGPYPDALMEAYPVSSRVNSPRNNGPECVAKTPLGE